MARASSLLIFLLAAGCASLPLDQERAASINDALANRAAIAKKCGLAEPDRSAAFLREASMRLDPAQSGLLAQSAARTISNAQQEEAEYICTPEMFEQSKTASDKAWAEWAKLKSGE